MDVARGVCEGAASRVLHVTGMMARLDEDDYKLELTLKADRSTALQEACHPQKHLTGLLTLPPRTGTREGARPKST
jgi:hypothetical protein